MGQLKDVIKQLNLDMIEGLKEKIKDKGRGTLVNEMSSNLKKTGFTIFATPALYFANYGRNPGKWPPEQAIKDWKESKSIPLSVWYIRWKIGTYGTKGKHYFQDIDDLLIKAQTELAEALATETGEELFNNFKEK